MKNLSRLSKTEQEEFFGSFDQILCDVDGVLWYFQETIPGACEAIKLLQESGKKIGYVSNNCGKYHEDYYNQLKSAGYNLDKTDLVQPVLAMIDYLKSIDFDKEKEIYVVGMTPLRTHLRNAGFKIAEPGPDSVKSPVEFIRLCTTRTSSVGAVIVDLDVNANYLKLQEAATHLSNPDVLFLVGGGEMNLCVAPKTTIIGPGWFQKIVQDITGRTPISMAKPNPHLHNFIKRQFRISDPSRVLFIGDTVVEDMGLASLGGYKKLLVLSGSTQKESLENWTFPEAYQPDYYVQSLDDVRKMLESNS